MALNLAGKQSYRNLGIQLDIFKTVTTGVTAPGELPNLGAHSSYMPNKAYLDERNHLLEVAWRAEPEVAEAKSLHVHKSHDTSHLRHRINDGLLQTEHVSPEDVLRCASVRVPLA